MSSNSPSVSNLRVKSNLLSNRYQDELGLISVFELRDMRDRTLLGIDLNPSCPRKVTPEQLSQWTSHLFWGDRTISMDDEDRSLAWLELLAEQVFAEVPELEKQPNVEDAFELLYVTDGLQHADSHYREEASRMSERIRNVLKRDEFRYSDDQIDLRLHCIRGDLIFPTETTDVNRPVARRRPDPQPIHSIPAHNV